MTNPTGSPKIWYPVEASTAQFEWEHCSFCTNLHALTIPQPSLSYVALRRHLPSGPSTSKPGHGPDEVLISSGHLFHSLKTTTPVMRSGKMEEEKRKHFSFLEQQPRTFDCLIWGEGCPLWGEFEHSSMVL